MPLRTHDVVVVAGEDGDAGPGLPVPDPDGLVIGRGEDPRVGVVEEDGADVVQVAVEGEEAPAGLVVPDLDLVVVAAAGEEGLSAVERDATDGTCGEMSGRWEMGTRDVPSCSSNLSTSVPI